MNDIDRVGDQAEEYFSGGLNCSESTLKALSESLGVTCDCVPSIATGMGGGVGHTGSTCGAITGVALAIGLAVPRMKLDDHNAEKAWANDVVTEAIAAFDQEFGETRCRDLIKVDFADPAWRDDYTARECKGQCCQFVRYIGDWAARRLAREGL